MGVRFISALNGPRPAVEKATPTPFSMRVSVGLDNECPALVPAIYAGSGAGAIGEGGGAG